ncbi:hypothetical protein C4J88_1061 [Pseudomonas sp. R4-39-08]|uniref:NEL-type E3 ubiquitin ligase domain-containing protein n=1 Tax=Pseudomonas sp. R4-39-08 TaxID=1173288 RepID=UPI000F55E499|nr:NEL-type E3 ubiquitin ligase domain-containing protein [Pseudomonas sp. R4-39-08]AZF35860.1 hypothetical protein C4J88_1061 [Pseudomonas sp. R4-39-08]
MPIRSLPSSTPARAYKGPHYDLIKQTIPNWVATTSLARAHQMSAADLSRLPAYTRALPAEHQALQAANAEGWRTQNAVDRQLRDIQDVYAFAEPLLKQAILEKYHLDLDVKATFLHLYIAKKLPWYAHSFFKGVTGRKVSLLDAALQNFAVGESFESDSSYITRPDYRGHFQPLALSDTMSIPQFKALCRELDLGARYQQHLNNYLLPTDLSARTTLKNQVIASQKAALKAAAHLACLPTDGQQVADLSAAAYHVLMRALRGERGVMRFYQLHILDASLSGILLIAADLDRVSSASKLIAYIPHDPESPVKEYTSSLAFMLDLTRKLQTNASIPSRQGQTYQQFFSQFVDHNQRGHFFAGLNQRLSNVRWHPAQPLDPRPQWREAPLDNPKLHFSSPAIEGDLWEYRYQQSFNKIFNDARSIAVPTADADRAERWAWWDNFTKILSDIFNVALLVITPFVPFLGELMLAYTAYQLTSDVIEGVVDLAEGQFIEAAEHLVTVATDTIQLGLFAVGGEVASAFKRSLFVDNLRAVEVDGQQRLWNPDLAPYAHDNLQLASDSQPDELGLHTHQDQKVLPLDNRHYVIEHDTTHHTHRIKHPTRPDAYSPSIEHHPSGAWVHEGEAPNTWDSETLRRRLGPAVEDLSPAQLEQACQTSGTHDDALRMMYAQRDTPPPLLADSLKRIKLRQQLESAPQQVRTGASADLPTNWTVQTTTELQGWPANKAIQVFINSDLTGHSIVYGATDASAANTLRLSYQAVEAGQWFERVIAFLSDTERMALLAAPGAQTLPEPVMALRERLANELVQQNTSVFNHLYSTHEALNTPQGRLIQQQFALLPKDLVTTLLLRTSPQESSVMSRERRIPLRLKNLARELANEVRASHASEGLYHDALLTPDTERMALNIVRLHTDALGDLNIAIHDQTPSGSLRCQVGPVDAGTKKILLYKGQGRYQLHDASPSTPPPQYSFYEALLRVVPTDTLDYRPGQGANFKEWLKAQLAPPAERRSVIADSPLSPAEQRTTQHLLQKPMWGAFRRWVLRQPPQPPTPRETLMKLCPRLTEEQIQKVLPRLSTMQGEQLLGTLEADHATLHEDMNRFRKKPLVDPMASTDQALLEIHTRNQVIHGLTACWEDGAYLRMQPMEAKTRGTLLDLNGLALGLHLERLGPLRADFSHVTRLKLSGSALGDRELPFLDNFHNLRNLDLSANRLDKVPSQILPMNGLTALNLGDNPIAWSPSDHATLKQCPQLRALNLEGNTRLETPPDVSQMPELRLLVLNRTGITQWPQGLESPRPALLELDLRNTAINTVPVFAPETPAARIVANSWLDMTRLEFEDEQRFVSYRRAQGIDPYRTTPRGGKTDSQFWMVGLTPEQRNTAQKVWDEVEAEHGSQGLFEVFRLLQPPAGFQTEIDAQLFEQGREDLSQRIWQVVFRAYENTGFRERVFSLAGAPSLCADAGAHTFNRIGVETLLEIIRNDNSPHLERHLVTLAKQTWRLEQINQIAHKEIQHRIAPESEGGLGQAFGSGENQVDDVQVYLAYQTGLKRRLDLPWLSEHMVYRNTAGLTQEHLDTAVRQVIELSQGDGLVNGILEQPFWADYLHDAHLEAFKAQAEKRTHAGSQLEDLRDAHTQWIGAEVTPERKARLREQLITLANELTIPHTVVLAEEPFSDATVQRLYSDIQDDYNELARRLTRQALLDAYE